MIFPYLLKLHCPKKSMSRKATFKTELDFCPKCGTVLPLPGQEDVVTCQRCNFQIDVKEFHGVEIISKVVFNKREVRNTNLDEMTVSGPEADRKCPKCGHEGMVYQTRQTRSADEGQTVFYTCTDCKFQDIEYS